MAKTITIELSNDQALVLFEFLARFDAAKPASALEDEAEQKVLWMLEASLEKELVEPLAQDYKRLVREARERVRDKE